jgi:hypothetical protein
MEPGTFRLVALVLNQLHYRVLSVLCKLPSVCVSPIAVAARSKARTVFARSSTEIMGLNPTGSMDVCVLCLLRVGAGKNTSTVIPASRKANYGADTEEGAQALSWISLQNLGHDSGCPVWVFHGFLEYLQGNSGIVPQIPHPFESFPINYSLVSVSFGSM